MNIQIIGNNITIAKYHTLKHRKVWNWVLYSSVWLSKSCCLPLHIWSQM